MFFNPFFFVPFIYDFCFWLLVLIDYIYMINRHDIDIAIYTKNIIDDKKQKEKQNKTKTQKRKQNNDNNDSSIYDCNIFQVIYHMK